MTSVRQASLDFLSFLLQPAFSPRPCPVTGSAGLTRGGPGAQLLGTFELLAHTKQEPRFPRTRIRRIAAHTPVPKAKHDDRPVPLTPNFVTSSPPGLLSSERLREERSDGDSRSSPTCRISQSILVSSMALRPKGHSCLSSRLLFSNTIFEDRGREGQGGQRCGRAEPAGPRPLFTRM